MDRKEIIERLEERNPAGLFIEADRVRRSNVGDEVHIRGIIEFSNYCSRSCLYCGLRKENKNISRYRMEADEIVNLANQIIKQGIKTIVLQSGDDSGFTQKMLSGIIKKIKKENPQVAITLSIGERPFDDYKAFKDAGADRYLLKHETANRRLYEKLHPGQTLKKRLEILEELKKLDYQIGAGNIVGLPEQTLGDLADDILILRDLDIDPVRDTIDAEQHSKISNGVDMAGIGPFIPQKDTPLRDFPCGSLELTLKILALSRIVTKNTHLPATTALATLDPEKGQLLGLKAGCDVLMPDFTPECYRKNYVIYGHKVRVNLERAREVIFKVKRLISQDRGDSLKCKKPQEACVCI
jgi:biotin synthase